jgi:hypothetical protein
MKKDIEAVNSNKGMKYATTDRTFLETNKHSTTVNQSQILLLIKGGPVKCVVQKFVYPISQLYGSRPSNSLCLPLIKAT